MFSARRQRKARRKPDATEAALRFSVSCARGNTAIAIGPHDNIAQKYQPLDSPVS
jgi:hypothetical protein